MKLDDGISMTTRQRNEMWRRWSKLQRQLDTGPPERKRVLLSRSVEPVYVRDDMISSVGQLVVALLALLAILGVVFR